MNSKTPIRCCMQLSLLLYCLPMMASQQALAVESVSPVLVSGFSWSYLSKLFMALISVLLFFVLFAWLMRRYQGVGRSQTEGLSIVASVSLGTRERLVVVQAGETQVLLGITPSQINSLTVLNSPLPTKSETVKESFQSNLEKILHKQPDKV